MSRSRLATQVSAIEQRSCDDHEICVRSHSRMMLELMREREATVRLMRIARDREARQRSCAEQHGLDCAVFRSQHSRSQPAIHRWRTAFGA